MVSTLPGEELWTRAGPESALRELVVVESPGLASPSLASVLEAPAWAAGSPVV